VRWRRAGRGHVAVTVRQRQRTKPGDGGPTPGAFRFGLEIVIHGAKGARSHRVTVSRARESFVLASPGAPIRIAVDPGFRVLKTLALAQPAGAWLHGLVRDPSPIERMRAARELAAFRTAPVLTALVRALARDRDRGVRMAAAIALGEAYGGKRSGSGTDRARTALVRAVRDKNAHVRRAAVFALGQFGKPAERALVRALDGERSYLVKAAALKALARIGSPRLLAICRAQMEDRGYRDLVPMAALDALAMAKVPAAFDDGYAAIRYGEKQEVREAGVRLLVALAGDAKAKRARPEQARHVAPALVALLGDPSVFARLAAMNGAARLKDRALLPALRRSQREEAWDHLQRTAQKAIAEIGRPKRRTKARRRANA
jgi:HEAT repeat protein